ncbi:MAG TPA: alpha-amylase family glycosyl hydrolase [Puia sp.]
MSEAFRPVDWIYSSNIYEVNLRQYTPEGTIAAFCREMPRLRDMGIDVLWFMPITPISKEKRLGSLGSYYACSDYTDVNPEFGTVEDFSRLVKEAHGLGFKVIIDIVANHTGWDHRWTREHPDFYRRNLDGQFFDPNGWEDVIDLNYDNPELRKAMTDVMRFWIEHSDVDGFRCDMAMLVPLEFWREARVALDPMKPLFWLAECEDIAYHEVFDATYTWKLLHKMEAIWRKEAPLDGLDEVLSYYDSQFPKDALRVFFTTNHDENSHSGSEYERLGDAAKAFCVLCCTWSGLPLIYSGQEMPNRKRLKFFDKDPIEWTGRYELFGFFQTLLTLRKRNPAMRAGDPAVRAGDPAVSLHRLHTKQDDRCFAFARKAGDNEVVVVLNFSSEWLTVANSEMLLKGAFQELFTGVGVDFAREKEVYISPWGYIVLEKRF